jgi:heme/copper-type cytochrome/quinol oxidase subunit 2
MNRLRPGTFWLVLLLAAALLAFAPYPAASHPAPRERTIRIAASQFAYAPGQIRVNPGDIVTLELVSTDVVHGLYLDEYGVSLEADPGQTASTTFTASQAGSFRFRCNVTCGAMHPFMIGRLTVGSNTALYRGLALTLLAAFGVLSFPSQRRTARDLP